METLCSDLLCSIFYFITNDKDYISICRTCSDFYISIINVYKIKKDYDILCSKYHLNNTIRVHSIKFGGIALSVIGPETIINILKNNFVGELYKVVINTIDSGEDYTFLLKNINTIKYIQVTVFSEFNLFIPKSCSTLHINNTYGIICTISNDSYLQNIKTLILCNVDKEQTNYFISKFPNLCTVKMDYNSSEYTTYNSPLFTCLSSGIQKNPEFIFPKSVKYLSLGKNVIIFPKYINIHRLSLNCKKYKKLTYENLEKLIIANKEIALISLCEFDINRLENILNNISSHINVLLFNKVNKICIISKVKS